MKFRDMISIIEGEKPVRNNRMIVRWQPARPRLVENGEDSIIWVDVEKLDAAWQKDKENYIGPGGVGAAIGGRYAAFGEWLGLGLEKVMTPEVYIIPNSMPNSYSGVVAFGNGRHRFSWCRDHGAKSIPVQIDTEQLDEFRKRYETSFKKCIIEIV